MPHYNLPLLQIAPLTALLDDPATAAMTAAGQRCNAVKHSDKDPALYLDRLAAVFR